MIRSAIAGILALFAVVSASAQQFPTVPSGTVIGRIGSPGTSGPSQAIPFATLKSRLSLDILVTDYGATGNGTTDDTAAIQAAFNAAAISGKCVYVPAGSYKVTSSLTGAVRCIVGDGYPGYGGTAYTSNSTQTTGFLSSTFVCSLTINCIALTSDRAFDIERLHIQYPSTTTGPGTVGLTLSAVAGATHVNSGSTIKDVMISGADNACQLNNIYEYKIDNLKAIFNWISGCTNTSPNYPNNGDSTVVNSTFWGNGVAGYLYHFAINSGGGQRFVNNKFNFGGVNTSCVILQPNLAVAQTIEPFIFANNSCEGAAVGVNFNNGNVANATISQVAITGNQIWVATSPIFVNSNGAGQWINIMAVSGNSLMRIGGAGVTVNTLDNINDLRWGGNTIECSGGCTGNTVGVAIAAHVTNSVFGNDTFGPTILFHYTSTSSVVFDDSAGVTFARLPATAANGSKIFVTDGTPVSSPCTGSSTGAIAIRQNGAWVCPSGTFAAIATSGSGADLTASTVTNAKLAAMSATTIKGNSTGGSTNPSDLTGGQVGGVLCSPVIQTVTTGTNATYTTPTCNSVTAKYVDVFLKGGGGGSPGSGTTPGAGGAGGDSCLKASGTACTTPLYAGLGGAAGSSTAGTSSAGGSFTGSCDVGLAGSNGGAPTNQTNSYGPVGGGGSAGAFGTSAVPAVPVNSGLGAGGPGTGTTANAGGGGGEGGSCRIRIFTPAASYVYTVGAAGTGGTLGTSGAAGIIGGNGRIEFIAHFQ